MNNEKELIKNIIAQRNKKDGANSSLEQSENTKKITLLNNNDNINIEKGQVFVNQKRIQPKTEQLSQIEIRQKYSEVIRQSIENERRANLSNRNGKFNTQRIGSHSAASNRSDKKRKRYYEYHNDYFNIKYERYNIQQLAYKIEKEFSKVSSNNLKFNERMQFYVAKQKIKEEKINELINIAKPHIDEKDKINTFNRLINDANRRIEVKKCLENVNSDTLKMNVIKNQQHKKCSSVKITNEEWAKIYQDRFMTKLSERNDWIKQQILIRKNKRDEEEKNYDEELLKRRKVVTKQELDSIAQRLYNKNYRDLFTFKKSKEYSTNNQTSPTMKNSSSNKLLTMKIPQKCLDSPSNRVDGIFQVVSSSNNLNNPNMFNNAHFSDIKDHNMVSSNKAEKIIDNFFIN